jgi:N-acetylglucosaminyl-diphospho-decaprenol L-rhamnosyltransferase
LDACAIIVTYRTGPALARCLASVSAATGLAEIILVDNGNEDAETRAMDAWAASEPRARIIRGHGNVGFAAACNLGAAQARAEALVFINPDVTLASDAVDRLTQALAGAPPPAIVGGDLRDREGRPERGGRRERLTLWRAFVSFAGLSKLERVFPAFRDFNRHRDPLPAAPVRVGAVSGALLCVRRADLATLGGFDDGYFLHVEDIDLCRRAEQAGWPVLFVPGPHGAHAGATSAAPAPEIAKHKARGFARYFRKFARSPFERMVGGAVGAVLLVLLPLIARR